MTALRVAVSGAGGRLGSALTRRLGDPPGEVTTLAWDLPDHDLDDPTSAGRLIGRDAPDLVIHAAAWTDVDGCARDPAQALRRNGTATGELAEACVRAGVGLIVVSTNEVFNGLRTDGHPYLPTDATGAGNPYGASKLAGELLARAAYGALGSDFAAAAMERVRHPDIPVATPSLAIVRTAWLFGPPGPDFPRKIVAAARSAAAQGEPLSLVADEVSSPTYAADLAVAIRGLVELAAGGAGFGGIYHIVNTGPASRAELGREALRLAGIEVATRDVPSRTWQRASTPPPWGVLEPTPVPGPLPAPWPLAAEGLLRNWREALAEYVKAMGPAMEEGN
jgi:dTDP-4-dehydrorhamnose reductase